ncbi:MAG: hypothetical protein IJY84_01955 [Clostridia bacterium]|nr:hypothetical protein [Clostridia bacterium]
MENKTKMKEKTIKIHSTGYKIMLVMLLVFYLISCPIFCMLPDDLFLPTKVIVFLIETAGVIFMLLFTVFEPASKGQMLFASEENPTKIPIKRTLIFILLTSLIFGFGYTYLSTLMLILFGDKSVFVKLDVVLLLRIFFALFLVVSSFIIMLTTFIISWTVAKKKQRNEEVAQDE